MQGGLCLAVSNIPSRLLTETIELLAFPSMINPPRWKEEYNLTDYLYFEAISVKEMSFRVLAIHIDNPYIISLYPW